MKMNKKSALGLAAVGVLLSVSLGGPAFARALGRMYGNSLHIENEPRSHTAGNFTLGNDDSYLRGKLEVDGAAYFDGGATVASPLRGPAPATQTLAAGFTIAADACGGVKLVTTSGAVPTSDTTNTFTAAATAGRCDMLVINAGPNEILLDNNTEFPLQNVASIRLAQGGSIRVYSNGTTWYHGMYTEY